MELFPWFLAIFSWGYFLGADAILYCVAITLKPKLNKTQWYSILPGGGFAAFLKASNKNSN